MIAKVCAALQISPKALPLICLIGAEFLSQLENQIAAIAIPILVLQFTHSVIATGIAGADGSLLAIIAASGWYFMPLLDCTRAIGHKRRSS